MNYKVGDTVICIDAQTILHDTYLVAGRQYVVHFTDGKNCTAVEGVENPEGWGTCHACGECNNGLCHFLPSRFIKVDGLTERQTEEQAVTA